MFGDVRGCALCCAGAPAIVLPPSHHLTYRVWSFQPMPLLKKTLEVGPSIQSTKRNQEL